MSSGAAPELTRLKVSHVSKNNPGAPRAGGDKEVSHLTSGSPSVLVLSFTSCPTLEFKSQVLDWVKLGRSVWKPRVQTHEKCRATARRAGVIKWSATCPPLRAYGLKGTLALNTTTGPDTQRMFWKSVRRRKDRKGPSAMGQKWTEAVGAVARGPVKDGLIL